MTKKINRRKFLGMTAAGAAGLAVASCAPAATPTPQIINKEVQVEVTKIVAGTPVVEQVVVTATAEPV